MPLFVQYAPLLLDHLALVFLAQVVGVAEDSAARVDLAAANLTAPADHPHAAAAYLAALAMLVFLAQVALVVERVEPAAQVE